MSEKIKQKVLRLLREDEEFRYAVAGMIGLDEILKRLDAHDQKFAEIIKRLEVHDEKFAEIVKRLDAHDEELVRLRKDMLLGFERMDRHLSALGARWGLMAEEAFREGLKALIEKEFGYRVERWVKFDEEGFVFGYPSQIEIDVAIRNKKAILVEIKSQATAPDVYTLKRKAEFYKSREKREPSKLLIVTPYAEEKALEAAKHLGIEIYTKI